MHVAFICLPAAGHVNPTLPVVAELVRRATVSPMRRRQSTRKRSKLPVPCSFPAERIWRPSSRHAIVPRVAARRRQTAAQRPLVEVRHRCRGCSRECRPE